MQSIDYYKKFSNILFLDIETVSTYQNLEDFSPKMQQLWSKKSKTILNKNELDEKDLFNQKGAIYSEFGKIITIAFGILTFSNQAVGIKVSYLSSKNEYDLLNNFKKLLETKFSKETILCAHNGKEFDFPYICRRMTILGIPIPEILNISGKKPWEVKHLDTLEMWKFGDRKSYTSLDLLTAIFNIKSSKSNMDGSEVHNKYYLENALDEISKYCVEDVIATIQVFLKMNFLKPVPETNIILNEYLVEIL